MSWSSSLAAALAGAGMMAVAFEQGRTTVEARVYKHDDHWLWTPGCRRPMPIGAP